jgi:Tfp pilus assembly protein PilZ
MPQQPISQHQDPMPGSREELRVRYQSADAFQEEYHQNVSKGALFIPTEAPYLPRERVDVVLDLAFCGKSISVSGEVVVVVDPVLAEAAGTSAGISLRLTEDVKVLRPELEKLSGISLDERAQARVGERRVLERRGSDADIRIETREGQFWGVTANISYAGVLALLRRSAIPIGTEVRAVLSNPVVELELFVDGKIVHRTPCHDGMVAHGIQLQYPAHRIDEVMSFIDFLQSFDRARRLASISGEIDESGMGTILEMFVSTAPSGTVLVSRGEEEGKIVFSENEILHCTLGIVSGLKALSRMFRWKQGRFEFHHDLQLTGETEPPQPLTAAMMSASVQMDEMARLDDGKLKAADSFEMVPERAEAPRDSLSNVESEVLDYAAEGFNVGSIFDVVAETDAEIYKALAALLEGGWIRRRCG